MPVVAADKNDLLAGRWTMSTAEGPQPHVGLNGARSRRYAAIDLAGITVRRAVSDDDFALVGHLRMQGFSRITGDPLTRWVDDFDHAPGVFSLIAYNCLDEAVATMRVQDGRVSELELSRFVSLGNLLKPEQGPAIQGARLSVIKKTEATEAMFALFKSVWRWCLKEQIRSILIASPPWAKPIYDFLMFEDLGPEGHFEHAFPTSTPHVSMRMPVDKPVSLWPVVRHPLDAQYNRISHPRLELDRQG